MRAWSSEASGSSSSSRRGAASRARPIATRCRSPPESSARPAVEQVADAQQLDDLVEAAAPRAAAGEPAAVEQVAAHGQMREQPGILEDVADAPAMARDVDAAARCRAATAPSSTIRPRSGRSSPAIALITVVLPAPERPNSAVTPSPAVKRDLERRARRAGAARSTSSIRCREPSGPRGRASSSEASIAAKASADRDQGQAQGAGFAAGDLGEGVDRRGQGLGLARDVGDEGDGGAELAQRLGVGQDHAGETPGSARGRVTVANTQGARRPACRPRPRAAGRPPRTTAGRRAPAAGSPSRRRPAPHRSSGTRTRCPDTRPAAPRSARAGRRSAAAGSR